jgi:hypothetical protein
MHRTENMIEGVGFYLDHHHRTPPAFCDCVRLVEREAYRLWEQSGRPDNCPDEFWFRAERHLFGGFQQDAAYTAYVCDLTEKKNTGHFRYWDLVRIAR